MKTYKNNHEINFENEEGGSENDGSENESQSENESGSDYESESEFSSFDDEEVDDGFEAVVPDKKAKEDVDLENEIAEIKGESKYSSVSATKVIHKQLMLCMKELKATEPTARDYTLDPNTFRNLYQWKIMITNFDKDLLLAQDLAKYNYEGIEVEMRFGPEYPIQPPFVRVIKPRFTQFCHGGGGHITRGGSICVDMLTNEGWSPTYGIGNVINVIKHVLCDVEPNPARLHPQRHAEKYAFVEAIEAFKIVANAHNWSVPKNFYDHLRHE